MRLAQHRWRPLAIGVLAALSAVTLDLGAPRPARADTLRRIGVLAKRGANRSAMKWAPLAAYLSEQVPDNTFEIVPLGFDEILPAAERHDVDFVLSNSAFYVTLERELGANRIATLQNLRQGRPYAIFGGVIFTRADHPVRTLQGLRGLRSMAVDATSLGGYLMAARELVEADIDPRTDLDLVFGGTHDAVVFAVLSGEVDAGTVRTDTLERMAEEGLVDLGDFRIIDRRTIGHSYRFPFALSTRLYPEWPIAALAHTDAPLTHEVAKVLLNMPPDHPAAKSARSAGWTVPQNYQPVHDLLKELRLRPYEDAGKVTMQDLLREHGMGLVGLLAAAVGLGLLAYYLKRANRRLKLSRGALEEAHATLEARVEARTLDLAREVEERRRIECDLRDNEHRLEHLASHDPLTNLPNRSLFHDRLQSAIVRARRSDRSVALLFLDLDRFKTINDTLGHDVGDLVLKEMAARIRKCLRDEDTVARLGGDEFVVVLENLEDPKDAALVAQKLNAVVQHPLQSIGFDFVLTASIGIGSYPQDAPDVEGLMKCADTAMYRAKDDGRDTYQFYQRSMNARAYELLRLETSLRRAIDDSQFILHYQPQFALSSGEFIGVEALARWQHPERGLLSPGAFITLAEETGLIVPLGEWVLRHSLMECARWRALGHPPITMAVNLSGRQFRQPNLDITVADALEAAGLPASALELELTESVVMADPDHAAQTMAKLANMGVRLAIDDFGTGYSSLAYLKRFPVHKLKIDRSFVRDLQEGSNDAAIVASVVALARSMSLETLAEGAETAQQVETLRKQGVDQVQGYLCGRPMPTTELLPRLGVPSPELTGVTKPRLTLIESS